MMTTHSLTVVCYVAHDAAHDADNPDNNDDQPHLVIAHVPALSLKLVRARAWTSLTIGESYSSMIWELAT